MELTEALKRTVSNRLYPLLILSLSSFPTLKKGSFLSFTWTQNGRHTSFAMLSMPGLLFFLNLPSWIIDLLLELWRESQGGENWILGLTIFTLLFCPKAPGMLNLSSSHQGKAPKSQIKCVSTLQKEDIIGYNYSLSEIRFSRHREYSVVRTIKQD